MLTAETEGRKVPEDLCVLCGFLRGQFCELLLKSSPAARQLPAATGPSPGFDTLGHGGDDQCAARQNFA